MTFSYTPIQEAIPRLDDDPEDGSLSIKQQATRLGVSNGLIRRAVANGLTPYQADKLVIKGLGLHPASVFGFDAWALAADIVMDENGDVDGREGVEALKLSRAAAMQTA